MQEQTDPRAQAEAASPQFMQHRAPDYGATMKWLVGIVGGLVAILIGGTTLLGFVAPTRSEYVQTTEQTKAAIDAVKKDAALTRRAVGRLYKRQMQDSENLVLILRRLQVTPAEHEAARHDRTLLELEAAADADNDDADGGDDGDGADDDDDDDARVGP